MLAFNSPLLQKLKFFFFFIKLSKKKNLNKIIGELYFLKSDALILFIRGSLIV